ncbi:GtrA family protein [Nitrosomonas sp. HPC101]|nr:GtrA family protein [Nitrosomonas sp. HPC101]
MRVGALRCQPGKAMFHRYVLVGGIATGFHYLTLLSLVEFGHVGPAMAAGTGAAIGAFVAYAGHRGFTFSRCTQPHRVALPRFLLLAALEAVMNSGIVWAGSEIGDWHYLASQIVATLFTLFVTYTFNSLWTFR